MDPQAKLAWLCCTDEHAKLQKGWSEQSTFEGFMGRVDWLMCGIMQTMDQARLSLDEIAAHERNTNK
eukprot:2105718-Pyramimonas_sp.AAC.1